MKKYIWILAALLLLALCAAQPPEPMPEAVEPTGFSLNASDISFFAPGELYDLKVKLMPEDADMPDVTWTSSDPNVASVSWNGRVTAISEGTVTVTATIEGLGEQSCIFRCRFAGSATPAVEPTPEPTPEPTAVGIEVDIGDGEHIFWVEAVVTNEPWGDSNKLLVNIYRDEMKCELLQTFETWWADPYAHGPRCFHVIDVDFDGDMDYAVCNLDYRSIHQRSYYIWDEEQEKFVEDPYGLNDLNNLEYDEEKQIIVSSGREWVGETIVYYQYRKGSLVCIRSLYYDYFFDDNGETGMRLEVKDEVNGELTTVYMTEIPMDELPEGKLWTEEFNRWFDLDYHGE